MTSSVSLRRAALIAAALAIAGAPSLRAEDLTGPRAAPLPRMAQSGGLPPGDVPGDSADQGGDAGALVVRVERLENQLRAANGAIEELQNQQRRLEEQIKRFQEDVEFRLGGAHGAAPGAIAEAAPAKPGKRSDAFDPSIDPNATGAPRPIGTTPPSAPLTNAPPAVGAPLDLSRSGASTAASPPPGGPLDAAQPGPAVIAGIGGPPDDPRDQFNAALEAYRGGQYEQAEQQFRAFLSRNANNRLAPDAVFYLGETFLQRSRPREAAEQYLKVSTDYAKSPRAPEGMLRLGQSLAALGNNDQACATFGEVGRRYPNASAAVKKGVERETQRDHC